MNDYRVVELLKEIKGLIIGTPKSDKWMNIKQASEYVNLHPTSLRRAVKSKELNASNKLGKLLFKESDIENWLNG